MGLEPAINQNPLQTMSSLGLRMFPIPRNSKRPATTRFHEIATATPDWQPGQTNVGVSTGAGVVVFDFDLKPDKGVDGTTTLAAWDALGIPQSLRVKTPSGGVHVYFTIPPNMTVKSTQNDPAPGVDIRGHHGYVVAPGSTIDGRSYEFLSIPDRIEPCPDFLLAHLRTAPRETEKSTIPLTEQDQPHILKRARDWLSDHAKVAIEGDSGDETTYMVAARLRDFGVSEPMALELMLEHWNEAKAIPPWHPDELARKVRNAYSYADRPPGHADATAEFAPLPPSEIERIMGRSRKAADGEEMKAPFRAWQPIDFGTIPRRDPLFGNHYIRKFVSATVAPGGLGKSALALAEAVSMASGEPFLGIKVKRPMRVVYFNAEDPIDEIQRRVAGLCLRHGISQTRLKDLWLASGRDEEVLLATGENGTLNGAAFDMLDRFGVQERIDVFIFDPLANMTTSPETNEVFRMLGKQLSMLADRLECAIEVVHHTRKLNGNEATVEDGRGGSALLNAVRAGRVLNRMTKKEAGEAGLQTHVDHFRIEADGKNNLLRSADRATWFARESVRLPNGDPVVAVVPWAWPEGMDGVSAEHLRRIVADVAHGGGQWHADVRASNWIGKLVAEAMGLDLEDETGRARAKRTVKSLLQSGVLREDSVPNGRQGRVTKIVILGDEASEYSVE